MERCEVLSAKYIPVPSEISVLDQGFVRYVDHYGQDDDLWIANIAWSSTNRHADEADAATRRME
ncbi:MAG: hypothetical protein IT564_11375 [Rhodospirillales bacterium]|nr:hypothetical protein [Rhodospirillales bacterium]